MHLSDHYLTDIEIEYIVNNKTLQWIHDQHYSDENINRIVNKMAELFTDHKLNEYDEKILDNYK